MSRPRASAGRARRPSSGAPIGAIALVAGVLAAAVGACTPATSIPATPPASTTSTTASAAPAPPRTDPPSTLPAWQATSTTTPAAVVAGPCPPGGSPARGGTGGATDPAARAAAGDRLAPALAALQGAGAQVGVTVWVDGIGEVAAAGSTTPLVPASNQKLLVAFAALELLPTATTTATTVVATGPTVGGVVQGDLVLVGGGDPTLTRSGPHSLATLAAQVGSAGITSVSGRLLVDESRYDDQRTRPGWADGAWIQSNVGLLSALVVDRNRNNPDPAFAADPTLWNLQAFRGALGAAGITVTGPDERGSGGSGTEVAALAAPPLSELIGAMLSRSDNLAAELLLDELGWRTAGVGSATAGIEASHAAAAGTCLALDGADADGSGLSRADTRSADGWRRLLETARTRPWYPTFRDALSVAGRSGTLATRLTGPATAGRVQAKTGSTAVSGALSGYLTASSGATVVFSIIVNQPRGAPEPAIDAFVTSLAAEL